MKVGPSSFIRIILIIGLFQGVLVEYFGLKVLLYACDLSFVIFFLLFFNRFKMADFSVTVPLLIFTSIVVVGIVINNVFSLQTLWGIRNNYRFFVFLYIMAVFMNESDVRWRIKLISDIFWPHSILMSFQYLFLGYRHDYLGGIWGTTQGCNSGVLIYYIGIIAILIYGFDRRKISLSTIFSRIAAMCLTSAWAELKFFYIVLIVMWGTYIVVSRLQLRTIGIIATLCVVIPLSVFILANVFEEFNEFFKLSFLINSVLNSKNYSNAYDIGRSAVFSRVPELLNSWAPGNSILFGIGIGNADYSTSFNSLNSDFYNVYSFTHYMWHITAFLLIETGYLGLISYIGLYVVVLLKCFYQYRFRNEEKYLFGTFLLVAYIMLIFYNPSLRSNYAYLAFFLMAVPFVEMKKDMLDFEKTDISKLIKWRCIK